MIKELDYNIICETTGVSFRDLLHKYSDLRIRLVFSRSLTFSQQVEFLNFFMEAYKNDEQAFYVEAGQDADCICLFSTGGKLKELWVKMIGNKDE